MNRRAIHTIFILLIAAALAGCATGQMAKEAQGPTVTGVEVRENAVAVSISGAFDPAAVSVQRPADPYLAVVDLPGAGVAPDVPARIASSKPGATEVRVQRTEAPAAGARVEVLLDSPAEVVPEYSDGSLVLRVKKGEYAEMPAPKAADEMGEKLAAMAEAEGEAAPEEPLSPATAIKAVRFDHADGTLKLFIDGDGSMTPQVYRLADRVIVDVPGAAVEAAAPEAVVSPVKAVRFGTYQGSARIVVELKKTVQVEAYAEGASVVLSMPSEAVPVIEKAAEAAEAAQGAPAPEAAGKKFTGKKISLDFQNADIVPIFRFIGDVAGYNVVVHPSVSGKITLKLMNVPWDQALEIILQTFNLGKSMEGNVMTIAPASVFAEWKEREADLKAATVKAAELRQEVIRINYAEAASVQNAIKGAKVMSPRGNLTVDQRMNTIIVNDTDESIAEIKDLVGIIDVPKPQVMIEAKIVEVDSNFSRTLGIRWGGSRFQNTSGTTDVTGNFSINTPVGSFGSNSGTQEAPKSGFDISIGELTDPYQIDLSLEALESIGKARRLANPRVLTIDGETANIQQGTSIPVQTTTAEGTQTEFVNANLNLSVTPRITPDGFIQLRVTAANDAPGDVTPGGIAINRKNVSTQAIVQDGRTLVIGGIYTDNKQKNESGLPILRNIPGLGWLFKTQNDLITQNELLILITPKIVKRQ
ncbi:MAG: hypothetical protein Kow0025_26520 [Thermodesulfovibrionales bacterium]